MRVRLLGPVDVIVGDQPRSVRGTRRKAVLATLALHRGEVVSTDRLADVLWGDAPPATPVNTLQSHISYLRRLLGSPHAIVSSAPGYLLDPARVDTDAAEAERLISLGRGAAGPARAALLREALSLWRGLPLADVPLMGDAADGLEQLRSQGVRALAETQLALGEHAEAVAPLEALVAAHPFDEQACALLMRALYRSGRQADALAAFRRLRRALHDELAVDPSEALRELETAILRQDLATAATPADRDADPPLLEREEPLAALVHLAEQARAGAGRVALVAGEAGVGKSALVERLRRMVPDARWLWSACDGLFTRRPLGPLYDLADQLGGDLLDAGARPGADRDHLFRLLLRQLEGGSRPGRPRASVIVVEDVHWADEATLDLLRFLTRRLRDAPVLLIVTYRDDGLGATDRLRVTLGDLASHRAARRIELEPLSPAAVRVLAARSTVAPAELHRLTGGNPFFVTEVLRAGTGAVPATVRDAVLARAARLGPEAREVLDAAALIGTRVEPGLLASVAGDRARFADELLTSGLLIADGSRLRFRHELARLAVAESVPPHRARTGHAGILAALEEQGCDDDARLAAHAEAAGDAAAVLRYAVAAAATARDLGCHYEAAAQLERALRFTAGVPQAVRAQLHGRRADEVAMLDDWQEAERAAERALALWRAEGDRRREGDTLRRLSRVRWNLGRGEEAISTVDSAVAVLEPLGPGVELAWAYATLANHLMLRADYPAAARLARRAETLADRAPDLRCDSLITRAVSAWGLGLEWTGLMREALALALAERLQDQAARAYCNLGEIYADERRFAEAEACVAEGIAYCEEHDLTTYAICLRGERADILMHRGRWDESVAATQALLGVDVPSPANRTYALIRLGTVAMRRGQPDAGARLDEALTRARASGEPQQIVPVLLARAEADWLDGRTEEALHAAEEAGEAVAGCDPWRIGRVASWLLRTGSSRVLRGPLAEPYDLLVRGAPAKAARLLTDLGSAYEAALVLTDAGDEASLRQALSTFTVLEATPAAGLVRRRLRALSRSARRGSARTSSAGAAPAPPPARGTASAARAVRAGETG